jgi:two-component system sensor histidine kinase UhpB
VLDSNPSTAVSQIRELQSFTTDALGELRQLIADLRPSHLDDLGLVPAMQWYIQEFDKRYPIQIEFTVDGDRVRLPSEYETVLFRIMQEALTNVAKHANASRATIKLTIQPAQICLSIRDDGRGFDVDQVLRGGSSHTGWGLMGIQERTSLIGGEYEIESRPGHGTHIRVQVPLMTEIGNVKDSAVTG